MLTSSSSASSGTRTGLPGTRVTGSSSESSEMVMSSLLRGWEPEQMQTHVKQQKTPSMDELEIYDTIKLSFSSKWTFRQNLTPGLIKFLIPVNFNTVSVFDPLTQNVLVQHICESALWISFFPQTLCTTGKIQMVCESLDVVLFFSQ